MTIAQRFVELGEQMGLDTSECKNGNITDTINAMTMKMGGEVSDNGVISTAMMNFTNALKKTNGEETEPVAEPTPVDDIPEEPEEETNEEDE